MELGRSNLTSRWNENSDPVQNFFLRGGWTGRCPISGQQRSAIRTSVYCIYPAKSSSISVGCLCWFRFSDYLWIRVSKGIRRYTSRHVRVFSSRDEFLIYICENYAIHKRTLCYVSRRSRQWQKNRLKPKTCLGPQTWVYSMAFRFFARQGDKFDELS